MEADRHNLIHELRRLESSLLVVRKDAEARIADLDQAEAGGEAYAELARSIHAKLAARLLDNWVPSEQFLIRETLARLAARGWQNGLFASLPEPVLHELCERLLDRANTRADVYRWLTEEEGVKADDNTFYRFCGRFISAYLRARGHHTGLERHDSEDRPAPDAGPELSAEAEEALPKALGRITTEGLSVSLSRRQLEELARYFVAYIIEAKRPQPVLVRKRMHEMAGRRLNNKTVACLKDRIREAYLEEVTGKNRMERQLEANAES